MTTQLAAIGSYARSTWHRRYFWFALAINDLRLRYRRSILGLGWSLVHPLAMAAVLCIAFSKIFNIDITTYGPMLLTGLAVWTFISSSISEGCHAFTRSEAYIRSSPAPLCVYALRTAVGVSIHFLITMAVTLLIVALVHRMPSLETLAFLVPTVGLLIAASWAICVLMGFANVYFPDTQQIMQVALQILFYLTPVMYPAEVIKQRGLDVYLRFNPLGYFVDMVRMPVMYGHPPEMYVILVSVGITALLCSLASIVLARGQNALIFYL